MKKFFKILMVLALLSGAALSCTKDYSKEIADVQKQNQDLQALVASLQNALNSTNATVSQLNSTSDKQAADIEDQALLIAALQAQAKELEEGIETVDGKATANAAAITKIDETLKGIATTLDLLADEIATNKTAIEANKKAIEANKTAIEAAQKEIEAIKAQIKSLSARLTNIVAAPAKAVEIQSFKWKSIERTTVNMNFVVAPASAAEAVAEGFKNGDVDIKLVINSGITRKEASKGTYNYVIIPDGVVAGDNGVITVTAVADTAFASLTPKAKGENTAEPTWDYYASLVVSGEDEAGAWERISDPVKPIIGKIGEVTYAWYEGNDEVKKINELVDLQSNVFGIKDSIVVDGNGLLNIIKTDWDWKSDEYKVENIIAGYEPKFKIGTTAYSVDEFKTAFDLPATLDIEPRFVGLYHGFSEPIEWGTASNPFHNGTKADSALFKVSVAPDSTIKSFGLAIILPSGEENENAEVVGKTTLLTSENIAFGKVDTCELGVKFVQRIGKHVVEEEAADGLAAKFGITKIGESLQAAKVDTTFAPVSWKSTTQVGNGKEAKIIDAEKDSVGTAEITTNSGNTKFVNVNVKVPYTDKKQELKIVLKDDAQKNSKDVIVLEHGDYIDLTVAPYHGTVNRTTTVKDFYLSRNTGKATIKTDITVKNLFSDINDWLIKDAKTADDAAIVYKWFRKHSFEGADYTVIQDKKGVGEAKIFINDTDTICVEFTKNDKLVEGKPVIIAVKDTIDGVIAFNYNVEFTPKKPGVKVETIPGFVQNGKIEVEGKIVGDKYVINDINLADYFKVTGLKEKNAQDSEIKVKFTNAPTGIKYSKDNSTYDVTTEGVLDAAAKVQWDALKATSFKLTAQALLEGSKVGEAVTVTVETADPILPIADVKIDSTLNGQEVEFNLLESLKIYSILDKTENIYSDGLDSYGGNVSVTKKDMSDWTCTVNGEKWTTEQMKNLFDATEPFANDILRYKAHDANGTVVITIPYKFIYKFGEKKFNVILTIN